MTDRNIALAALVACSLASSNARADEIQQAIKILASQNKQAAKAQQTSTDLSDETDKLEEEYTAISNQADSLSIYVEQLLTTVQGQRDQVSSLEAQIDRVTDVGRRVIPLMRQMVEALDKFVDLDVPFLMDERRQRVDRLKTILDASDVTDAEKFRQILEAYQVENEFGRTIEAYQGRLTGGEQEGQAVNFLRFGRVALVYATLDGRQFGAWDPRNQEWVRLPASYGPGITRGLRVARKQAAPDLVMLPIPAPVQAEGGGE
ncbi:MAG: DUF3450 domain-containing protein [Myxococcota bacterium]